MGSTTILFPLGSHRIPSYPRDNSPHSAQQNGSDGGELTAEVTDFKQQQLSPWLPPCMSPPAPVPPFPSSNYGVIEASPGCGADTSVFFL